MIEAPPHLVSWSSRWTSERLSSSFTAVLSSSLSLLLFFSSGGICDFFSAWLSFPSPLPFSSVSLSLSSFYIRLFCCCCCGSFFMAPRFLWLFKDVKKRHGGLLEVSKRETDWHGPPGSCAQEHKQWKVSFTHTQTHTVGIELSAFPQKKCFTPTRRGKQRDGVFSPLFPTSSSAAPAPVHCLCAAQYKHAGWSKSLRCQKLGDKMDVRGRRDEENTDVSQSSSTAELLSQQRSGRLVGVSSHLCFFCLD